jgi:CBS domain-containing protein
MAKTVRDLMAENPETVEPSDSVADAAKKMKSADTGALLVTDGEALIAGLSGWLADAAAREQLRTVVTGFVAHCAALPRSR